MYLQSLQIVFILPIVGLSVWLWTSDPKRIKWKWIAAGLMYVAAYFLVFHFMLKQF